MPRSHRQEYESAFPYMGSSKHEFACIPMAEIHIDTSTGYMLSKQYVNSQW